MALSGYGGEYGDYGDYGGYGGYGGGYDEGQLRSGRESDIKHAQQSSTFHKSHRLVVVPVISWDSTKEVHRTAGMAMERERSNLTLGEGIGRHPWGLRTVIEYQIKSAKALWMWSEKTDHSQDCFSCSSSYFFRKVTRAVNCD